jgi:hypothetical protein
MRERVHQGVDLASGTALPVLASGRVNRRPGSKARVPVVIRRRDAHGLHASRGSMAGCAASHDIRVRIGGTQIKMTRVADKPFPTIDRPVSLRRRKPDFTVIAARP